MPVNGPYGPTHGQEEEEEEFEKRALPYAVNPASEWLTCADYSAPSEPQVWILSSQQSP